MIMEENMRQNGKVRQRLVFTGRVQGVGFRYRAKHAANLLGLTGWVKNEWDGSVVLEVQGSVQAINELMKFINSSPFITIDWIDRKDIPWEEHDTGFHVR